MTVGLFLDRYCMSLWRKNIGSGFNFRPDITYLSLIHFSQKHRTKTKSPAAQKFTCGSGYSFRVFEAVSEHYDQMRSCYFVQMSLLQQTAKASWIDCVHYLNRKRISVSRRSIKCFSTGIKYFLAPTPLCGTVHSISNWRCTHCMVWWVEFEVQIVWFIM